MTAATERVCAFCRGMGMDPYGILRWGATCYVCRGKGTVLVPFPHVPCRYCNGTGSHKTFSCTVCRGAGVVPPVCDPRQLCSDCGGRAYEISSGLECLMCKGRGVVTVAE
mgnify:CR=1 FL=1